VTTSLRLVRRRHAIGDAAHLGLARGRAYATSLRGNSEDTAKDSRRIVEARAERPPGPSFFSESIYFPIS